MTDTQLSESRTVTGGRLILLAFPVLAILLFLFNAFPSLSGDEYGSLVESQQLGTNLHAMSYFLTLRLWSNLSQDDWFLRALSLLWLSMGGYWLSQWLAMERVPEVTRKLVLWLVVLNPFLWWYGLQIRFYGTFLAASILFAWRFRVWQGQHTGRNITLLLLSTALLATSHLFGLLVAGIVLLNSFWEKIPGRKRWWLVPVTALGVTLIFLPPIRSMLVESVVGITNATAAPEASRGISLAMLVKIPLTFYSFTLGERVYPLWWWVTLPALLVMGVPFLLGLWRLREHPPLASLSIFMLLSIPLLYLVLDPLAPPSLQGAAPRYLIFVIPYFLYVVVLGAGLWKPLIPAVILVCLAGLYFLGNPTWTNGSGDLIDWKHLLTTVVPVPEQTCILTDGRAKAPVSRYAPAGTRVGTKDTDCSNYSRIVLVTNDHRLFQVRNFDGMAGSLGKEYNLISNTTFFPAQLTVYEKGTEASSSIIPSRLDLPEQDLRFPIQIRGTDHEILGFVRLDASTPKVQLPIPVTSTGTPWVLTNFRTAVPLAKGTPVFRLQYTLGKENKERQVILRSDMETAVWDGNCDFCVPVYTWRKLLHLVGSTSYPGAYRQYSAHIWGIRLPDIPSSEQVTSMTITYLLPDGTGYFYEFFPDLEGFRFGQ